MLSDSPRPFPRARPVDNSVTLVLATCARESGAFWEFRCLTQRDKEGSLKVGLQTASFLVNEVYTPHGRFPRQMMDNTNIQ